MDPANVARLQRFIDSADGRDIDINKVQKQILKQNLPDPTECPPGQGNRKADANKGFVSAAFQFQ